MRIKVWGGYFYGLRETTVYVAETEARLMAKLAEVAALAWTGDGDLKEVARSEVGEDYSEEVLHEAMIFKFNDEEGDQYLGTSDFDVIETDDCEVV